MRKSIRSGLILLVAVMVMALVACNSGSAILGKWAYDIAGTPSDTSDDIIFEFKTGGTCNMSMSSMGISYDISCTISGNSITMTEPMSGTTTTMTYSISGNTLKLSDTSGVSTTMTRVP
jgi:hypothetical protein